MIKAVLFDLDGTLLPMDQEVFIKAYFGGIAKRLAPYGYEHEKLISAIWRGTGAMLKNDGKKTNEAVFWDKFAEIFGESARDDEPYFEEFYVNDFDEVKAVCGFTPKAKEVVELIKSLGFRTALATTPIFPAIATKKRMMWAGLSPEDFELYTTYENSHYCKPSVEYYREVAGALNVAPCECLMVGNDVGDDMPAAELGMRVFLLTDCLINKENKDITSYPHGGFDELFEFLKALVQI